ncbi:MAG: 2-hydroxychromene-2-carboxylate isomerase [Deltaproteobacteria bacterium]|nr:MAG: 2-hydroxychromene-2-carboxylate isomerase [Deltaproteobacteria bacterium]
MRYDAAVRLEYWFDFSCPYAYLGSTQIESIAARAGAELVWQPMLLGGVFRALSAPQVPAAHMPAAKARYNALDMLRWADHFGVDLRVPAGHPMRTVRALRALLALPQPAWPAAIHALYRAYWVDGRAFDDPATIAAALRDAGAADADIDRALAANDDPAIKTELRRRTDEAVRRGVFGAPTMFVGDDEPIMFWGQDRLPFVERALAGWRPR